MMMRIMRWGVTGAGAVALLGAAAAGAAAPAAAGKSSCVECHRQSANDASLRHSFADWAGSRHAGAGVGCESCHGGDPTRSDKSGAHKGLVPSTQPTSPVYFTKLPETCGTCHTAEFKAFRQSAHFKELQTSGRGPNCVTCHGAMASHILDPRTMEMTCTLCHRRPTNAYAALQALYHATGQVGRLKSIVERGRREGADVGPQAKKSEEAERKLADLRVQWHTFRMDAVIESARALSHLAIGAAAEVKLKNPTEAGK